MNRFFFKNILIWILCCVCIGMFSVKAKAFCVQNTELSGAMTARFIPETNYYKATSQGFCVAGDKIIYTRYSSDSQDTVYVILDAKTMREVSHQSFHTLHSNSLTYNPYKKEVVCVTERHAYIFSFDGKRLHMVKDYYMNHNCPKIAYVKEERTYYLGTSKYVFKTDDFGHLTKAFSVTQKGINQGMGACGQNLYIIWYNYGNNIIDRYDTSGHLIESYTINSSIYREVEEVDFYGEYMYVSIANSGTANGLYRVENSHPFGSWEVLKKETCGDTGVKGRTCSKCGYVEKMSIPATGKHKKTGWIIISYPECETPGQEVIRCKVCGHDIQTKTLPEKGHLMQEWTTSRYPDALHDGILKGTCIRCGKTKRERIHRLSATITMDTSEITLSKGKKSPARDVELTRGDYISSWRSSDTSVVKIKKDGSLQAVGFGNAHITCFTKAGQKASFDVTVSVWKTILDMIY